MSFNFQSMWIISKRCNLCRSYWFQITVRTASVQIKVIIMTRCSCQSNYFKSSIYVIMNRVQKVHCNLYIDVITLLVLYFLHIQLQAKGRNTTKRYSFICQCWKFKLRMCLNYCINPVSVMWIFNSLKSLFSALTNIPTIMVIEQETYFT